MGNLACCCQGDGDKDVTSSAAELSGLEAQPVLSGEPPKLRKLTKEELGLPAVKDQTYRVRLDKRGGEKLGLDVDYMEGRTVLPVIALTGGLAESWNVANPQKPLRPGDSIVEVNGVSGSAAAMLEKCKVESVLELTVRTQLTYEHLVSDLEELIRRKGCGPILIRLSWHDAGSFSTGSLAGGCPNAVMRFAEGGEGKFEANAGLPEVAIPLLSNISAKYCPALICNADLWALAANVAIRLMGGPDITTRFGRVDARSSSESVPSQEGRYPEASEGADHLRRIFYAKGFDDKDIVALSGAHCVGRCKLERSGFDGAWTTDILKFDNSYFRNLLERTYSPEKNSAGNKQYRCPVTKTMMLESDIALIADPGFRWFVEAYAKDQDMFFADFADCWPRLQEVGYAVLRDIL